MLKMIFRTEEEVENERKIRGIRDPEYLNMLRTKVQEKREEERSKRHMTDADSGEWFRPMPKKVEDPGSAVRVQVCPG